MSDSSLLVKIVPSRGYTGLRDVTDVMVCFIDSFCEALVPSHSSDTHLGFTGKTSHSYDYIPRSVDFASSFNIQSFERN